MPLAYVLEEKEFWSLRFKVAPGVLIPRPETELLVEKVIGLSSERKELIADIGTGAGNISVALAKELPRAKIVATDVSDQALDLARQNARMHEISTITFEKGSLFAPLEKLGLQKRCDFIVSNPPYVSEDEWQTLPEEIKNHEPKRALVPGESGFEIIEKLIQQAPEYLRPGGYLCLEIGWGQMEKVLSFFGESWLQAWSFDDLNGIPRAVVAQA